MVKIRNQRKTERLHNSIFLLLVSLYCFTFRDYLLGNRFIFHDNLPFLTDSILSNTGRLALEPRLRSGDQTLGIPTWINSEIRIGFDPLNILFGSISSIFNVNLLQVEAWRLSFLFLFCVFCVWQITIIMGLTRLSQACVILLLLQSPISMSLWGQAAGLLMPFKYVPLTILFILKFIRSRKSYHAIIAVISFLISIQTYQGIYALTFYLFFAGVFFKKNSLKIVLSIVGAHPIASLFLFMINGLCILPLFLALFEVREKFFVLPREVFRTPYFLDVKSEELQYIFNLENVFNPWHGGLWVGYFSFLAIVLGMFFALSKLKNGRNASSKDLVLSKIFLRLVLLSAISFFFATASPVPFSEISSNFSDGGTTFLGARNWGFYSSVFNCLVVFSAGISVHLFVTFTPSAKDQKAAKRITLCLAFLLVAVDLSRIPAQARAVDALSNAWMPKDSIVSASLENFRTTTLDTTTRDFLFNPKPHFPFTSEGATLWGISSMNYLDTYSEYANWEITPTTTLTHSYEYRDYRLSKDYSVFSDELLWRNSRFSKIFYLSTKVRCYSEERYNDDLAMNNDILYYDIIKSGDLSQPVCKPPKFEVAEAARVKLISSGDTNKRFSIQTDQRALLLVNENYDANFRAHTSTGNITRVYPANRRALAVELEPGTYDLDLVYTPTSYLISIYLRLITLTFLLLVLIWSYARRRECTYDQKR
jgi:hypothetical protein